jgi:ankyrin repeat protein
MKKKNTVARLHYNWACYLLNEFKKMLLINCFKILFVFIASQNGHTKMVELLLNKNASVKEKDNDGKTALHKGMILIVIFKNILFKYIIYHDS